jgi:hypothetical protein
LEPKTLLVWLVSPSPPADHSICEFVCVREGERGREREGEIERDRERERDRECV